MIEIISYVLLGAASSWIYMLLTTLAVSKANAPLYNQLVEANRIARVQLQNDQSKLHRA